MIGRSEKFLKAIQLASQVAKSDVSVVLFGENGTGKEGLASKIHSESSFSMGQFVAINCGAIPTELFESQFFGHVKGAFTGAISSQKGYFAAAHGGTLFLDEVGDLPLVAQVKLLRVLESKTYLPVGAQTYLKSDVRIVSATNKDLRSMVTSGHFREDLYFRLCVFEITLPPLRERLEDLTALSQHFISAFDDGFGDRVLHQDVLKAFETYHWPGNLRELKNEITRLCVLSGGNTILSENLLSPKFFTIKHGFEAIDYAMAVQKFKQDLVQAALQSADGNFTTAAKSLNLTPQGLRKILKTC